MQVESHLRELPHGIDRLVVQAKFGCHAVRLGGAGHVPNLRLPLVAKGVIVQVVDVRHVNGILKHAPADAITIVGAAHVSVNLHSR
jgi:hypothetical protein